MSIGKTIASKVQAAVKAGGSLQNASPEAQADIAHEILNAVMQTKPNPSQFTGPGGTNADGLTLGEAMSVWTEQFVNASAAAQQLTEAQYGTVKLPDGTIVPTGDAPPELLAAIKTANQNAFNKLASDFQLDSYKLANDKAQAEFNNNLSVFNAKRGLDQDSLSRAEARVSRQLQGQAESRQRADMVTQNILDAAPYTTQNGKTSFSPMDIGSAATSFASRLGLDPSQSILNFGMTTIDPEGLMNQYDANAGVGGRLTDIPDSILSMSDIPSTPQFGAIPTGGAPQQIISAPEPSGTLDINPTSQVSGTVSEMLNRIKSRIGELMPGSSQGSNPGLAQRLGISTPAQSLTPSILDSIQKRYQ